MSVSSLGELLRDRAERYPDNEAIVSFGAYPTRMSYAVLQRHVDATICALRRVSKRSGERIAIILPNCAEYVIAFQAIVSIVAIAVPINPRLRASEVERLLRGNDVAILFVDRSAAPTISALQERGYGPLVVFWREPGVEGFEVPAATSPALPAEVEVGRSAPAYSLYSTGSTGAPRRVTRTHGHALDEMASVSELLSLGPADRFLAMESGRSSNVVSVRACVSSMARQRSASPRWSSTTKVTPPVTRWVGPFPAWRSGSSMMPGIASRPASNERSRSRAPGRRTATTTLGWVTPAIFETAPSTRGISVFSTRRGD